MKVVVTAGPTREHLDPVRFLSNPSTGKMGFAVAAEAARRGHEVVLVAGPVSLPTPKGVRRVDVVSARDMLCETRRAAKGADVLVATAAVADWRPAVCAKKKLKKDEMEPFVRLVRNPDVLKTVKCPLKVGFAAETGDPVAEAMRKCREKKLALIVANDVTAPGAGFGTDTNMAVFVYPDGRAESLPMMSKRTLARRIVVAVESERMHASVSPRDTVRPNVKNPQGPDSGTERVYRGGVYGISSSGYSESYARHGLAPNTSNKAESKFIAGPRLTLLSMKTASSMLA